MARSWGVHLTLACPLLQVEGRVAEATAKLEVGEDGSPAEELEHALVIEVRIQLTLTPFTARTLRSGSKVRDVCGSSCTARDGSRGGSRRRQAAALRCRHRAQHVLAEPGRVGGTGWFQTGAGHGTRLRRDGARAHPQFLAMVQHCWSASLWSSL
jgi:hypothetical protein